MNNNIDQKNSTFWNDICGTHLAHELGITDDSQESLKRYDDFYLNYYPYLLQHVPVTRFKGLKVLEIGLGYGTLSQQIAENCAYYRGLDIAEGPVNMVNKRMKSLSVDGKAIVGSIKDCPFDDNTFDVIVSIGCFHHTGDLKKAIQETYRVLKPGGVTYLMVYNKYSYRQILRFPFATLNRFFIEKFRPESIDEYSTEKERAAFDTNKDGEGAPETKFYSAPELTKIMTDAGFGKVKTQTENADSQKIRNFTLISRNYLLKNIAKSKGLDIYFSGVKD